jgi:hypothetical protein
MSHAQAEQVVNALHQALLSAKYGGYRKQLPPSANK